MTHQILNSMIQLIQMDHIISIVDAPIYQGQKQRGVSLGPSYFKQCLLDQNFQFNNYPLMFKQNNTHINYQAYQEISYCVEREYRRNKLVVTVGGDHSVALGSVQGLLRCDPQLKVIWVDAHGDINTRESSLTGAFHGMPLAFLLGADLLPNEFSQDVYLKPENLIYFGLRDLDLAEKTFLDENKILNFTSQQILEGDLDDISQQISADVQGTNVHFSIDTDAFDPRDAFATGIHVAKGIRPKHLMYLFNKIKNNCSVKSFDFVELNPQIMRDQQDVLQTAQIGIDFLKEVQLNHNFTRRLEHDDFNRKHYSEESNLLHQYL